MIVVHRFFSPSSICNASGRHSGAIAKTSSPSPNPPHTRKINTPVRPPSAARGVGRDTRESPVEKERGTLGRKTNQQGDRKRREVESTRGRAGETQNHYPFRFSAFCRKNHRGSLYPHLVRLRNSIGPLSRIGPQPRDHGIHDTSTQGPIR